MFALVDANNFYASCERLFRPDLRDKPIIVLSGNDGCVIARSNEAKALGIDMGIPYFKVKALCMEHKVNVFSSNFALYGDLSARVMHIIERFCPKVQQYSIDEAFIDLSEIPQQERESFCYTLQKIILRNTGIPTTIGIGKTKTQAKAASFIAKKWLKIPVCMLDETSSWLAKMPVSDVWGIGRRLSVHLHALSIYTVGDLLQQDERFFRKKFGIPLTRTIFELKGQPCFSMIEGDGSQKSILSSKSFGQPQTSLSALQEAISNYVARAHEKLRSHDYKTKHIQVFLTTSRFREDLPQYRNSAFYELEVPTDDIREITSIAKKCIAQIYREGYFYKKVGVYLLELSEKNTQQHHLFAEPSTEVSDKQEQLMNVMETIQQKYGRKSLHLAAEGCKKSWSAKNAMRSPAYTTSIRELRRVKN